MSLNQANIAPESIQKLYTRAQVLENLELQQIIDPSLLVNLKYKKGLIGQTIETYLGASAGKIIDSMVIVGVSVLNFSSPGNTFLQVLLLGLV